jgi:Tfp pilus assembly protein PilP
VKPPSGINPNPAPILTEGILTAAVPGDINVVGILFRKDDPIALVKVRNVKGLFKLKVNSRIGRSEGRVIEIQRDRFIVEQVRDFDGQKFTEKVELKIRERKR